MLLEEASRCKKTRFCTSKAFKQGVEVQNGPFLHLQTRPLADDEDIRDNPGAGVVEDVVVEGMVENAGAVGP